MSTLQVAIVNATHGKIRNSDVYALKFAAEQCAADRAKAYGIETAIVELFDDEAKVPSGWALCRILWGSSEDQGALAVHYWDRKRGALAIDIYADRASAFNLGRESVAEALTHEFEAMNNPRVSIWKPHPDADLRARGYEVAYEDADPVQDTYDVTTLTGQTFQVANFVLPSWFAPGPHPEGTRFDHAGRLSRAGEIGPEGYAVVRRRVDGRWVYEYQNRMGALSSSPPEKRNGARAHKSRVEQLIAESEREDLERAQRETEPDQPT